MEDKMNSDTVQKTKDFLDALGLTEEPLGIYYTDREPEGGISPKPLDLPTREKEAANRIDWQTIFSNFSCVIGNIWRARRKKAPAVFDSARFGCPGGAFFLGFLKPQTDTIIRYVSSGVPGYMEGELYCESPEELAKIFDYIDPPRARTPYCVVKPLSLFTGDEKPELVAFFSRPESICGLHQLAAFVTNDPNVVASPWGAACTNLITWPMKYLRAGENKAVLGGWDPSARKFFKTDELSFTVPYGMFLDMVNRCEESFLKTHTWEIVRKKVFRSRKVWGEEA
jgi:uncharacterized protein (DUF169 family)